MARKLVGLEEAAKMLGVSAETLAEMRERQKVHGYRDGSSWKFKPEDIERLIADREAAEQEGEFAEVDEDPDSILLSEVELGQSGESTSSTIIGGASSKLSPSESDIQLAPPKQDSDLDLDSALAPAPGGSDVLGGSDVVPASGSGVSPRFDELDTLDLDLPSAADSGISSKIFSDIVAPASEGSKAAADAPAPNDWVYVNNFEAPNKPIAIRLPPGRAAALAKGMVAAIDELRAALPAIFESEDYLARRRSIDEELRGAQEDLLEALNRKAAQQSIAVLRTPMGFAMAPMLDGKVVKPEVFGGLPEAMRRDVEAKIATLQQELEEILSQGPRLEKSRRARLSALNEEFARRVLRAALDDVEADHRDLPDVLRFLAAAENDLVRNVELFVAPAGEDAAAVSVPSQPDTARDPRFRRYMVNVMVSADGAPAPARFHARTRTM